MKKTRMISVIAASLLTATVVFTGCGGGGSSTTGGTTSSSSSTPQITPKTVTVADGYVLGATVKSGSETAVATTAGHYQFADASKVTGIIVSTGGTNDLNENGQADANEPTAPTLKAPASYSNVNPMTTLMVESGLTEQQIINYYNTTYGLNLTTLDFDPVQADAKTKAEVVALGYLLSIMQNSASTAGVRDGAFPDLTIGASSSSTTTTSSSNTATSTSSSNGGAFPDLNGGSTSSSTATTSSSSEASTSSNGETSTSSNTCLPGQPCSSTGNTSSSSSSSVAPNININTLADAIKNNLRLEEVYPNLADVLQDIRTKVENGKEDDLTCDFTAHKPCTTQGNEETSGGGMSSSEGMSSSACLPGQPCGSSSNETSSTGNSSSSNSQTSSTNSTSTSTSNNNGGAFPDLNGGSITSTSSTTSSVSNSSSSVSSISNGGTTNSSGAFPDLSQ